MDTRKIVIISVVGVAIVILGIVGIVAQLQGETTPEPDVYVDPGSGEKIIDTEKAQHGDDITFENSIIYPGFSTLIERGLSPVQVQSVQSTIEKYSIQQPEKFKEVSLNIDSMRHLLPQGGSQAHTLTFDIKVDRQTDYYMTVEYEDTESAVTKLYKSDKTTLLIEG
ncbi:MAG TPA: hypothetical protein VFM68_00885 [Candidatus Saccharimonadales bacterium]|nr:hypothetical protein [Candidatus Saccharimonadales bacterium]